MCKISHEPLDGVLPNLHGYVPWDKSKELIIIGFSDLDLIFKNPMVGEHCSCYVVFLHNLMFSATRQWNLVILETAVITTELFMTSVFSLDFVGICLQTLWEHLNKLCGSIFTDFVQTFLQNFCKHFYRICADIFTEFVQTSLQTLWEHLYRLCGSILTNFVGVSLQTLCKHFHRISANIFTEFVQTFLQNLCKHLYRLCGNSFTDFVVTSFQTL